MVGCIRRIQLGERLREERQRLGFSQAVFGGLVERASKSQERYETGQRSPSADYLMAAAEHGVDVTYLLTGVRAGASPVSEFRPTEQAAELPGREPASPRDLPSPGRASWRRVSGAVRRFEASLAADVIGAALAVFLVYAIFVFAGVLQ